MTNYLVTGGSGFIGAMAVRRLISDGHNVRVLDNNSRGRVARLEDVMDDIEFVEGDVRDADTVSKAAKGAECILHLAAVNGTENFYKFPELVLDVGVRGMLAVLDACRKQNVPDLVVASSSEAYQTPPHVPTDESVPLVVPDPLNPRYSYGASKLISELLTLNYARTCCRRAIVFRPHNVYGPDMGWEHVLPQFILRALEQIDVHLKGRVPFPIQGDGSQTRAFVYIDDFIDGLVAVLNKGEHFNIYHIGTDQEVTIRSVAETVFRQLGRAADIQPGPAAHGGTNRRCPDIAKIRALGYQPKVSLEEGVRRTVEWYATNRALRLRTEQQATAAVK